MQNFILFALVVEITLGLIAIKYVPARILKGVTGLAPEKEIGLTNEIRKMIGSVLGVILVVSAGLGVWQDYRLREYSDFGKEANAAFGLIDSDKPAVRVGGVYSLSRVIRNSPDDAPLLLAALVTAIHEWSSKSVRKKSEPISVEAMAAITIVGQHQSNLLDECGSLIFRRLNLARIVARDLNLNACSFHETTFSGSDLSNLKLKNGRLINVEFTDADLTNAEFANTFFDRVDFSDADLRGADFLNVTGLEPSLFARATIDDATKFPPGFQEEIEAISR